MIGGVLAAVIALLALRVGSLSRGGAVAAWICGTAAMAAGWSWGIVLIAYFVASSTLSRFMRAEKNRRTEGRVEKAGARDAVQVLANGGLYALAALAFVWGPDAGWQVVGAGALAASSADTWATEMGSLAPTSPRSIRTLRPVAVGTSGGVTLMGTMASVAGALFVGLVAFGMGWPGAAFTAALVGGVFGALLDSVLGAWLQARYWCQECRVATERRRHHCGTLTSHAGGLRWLDNDGVNALATVGGAAAGFAAAVSF
jgi:uncharacterized protein (TIGR00297 family)